MARTKITAKKSVPGTLLVSTGVNVVKKEPVHREEQVLTCDVCSLNLDTQEALTAHRGSTHPFQAIGRMIPRKNGTVTADLYNCNVCKSSEFITQEDLTVHQQSEHPFRPLNCGICGASFSSKTFLHDHVEKHVEPGPSSGPSSATFNAPKSAKKVPIPFSILKLQDIFPDSIRKQGKAHTNSGVCICSYCCKAPSETEFKCETCSAVFKLRMSLKQHKAQNICSRPDKQVPVENKTEPKKFKCDKCSAEFSLNIALNRHNTQHHHTALHSLSHKFNKVNNAAKNFVCNFCSAEFKFSIALKKHNCSEADPQTSNLSKGHLASPDVPSPRSLENSEPPHIDEKPGICKSINSSSTSESKHSDVETEFIPQTTNKSESHLASPDCPSTLASKIPPSSLRDSKPRTEAISSSPAPSSPLKTGRAKSPRTKFIQFNPKKVPSSKTTVQPRSYFSRITVKSRTLNHHRRQAFSRSSHLTPPDKRSLSPCSSMTNSALPSCSLDSELQSDSISLTSSPSSHDLPKVPFASPNKCPTPLSPSSTKILPKNYLVSNDECPTASSSSSETFLKSASHGNSDSNSQPIMNDKSSITPEIERNCSEGDVPQTSSEPIASSDRCPSTSTSSSPSTPVHSSTKLNTPYPECVSPTSLNRFKRKPPTSQHGTLASSTPTSSVTIKSNRVLQKKLFSCIHCDLQFNSIQFSDHMKVFHKVERPFSCEVCTHKFSFYRYLQDHTNRVHSKEKVSDECPQKVTVSSLAPSHSLSVPSSSALSSPIPKKKCPPSHSQSVSSTSAMSGPVSKKKNLPFHRQSVPSTGSTSVPSNPVPKKVSGTSSEKQMNKKLFECVHCKLQLDSAVKYGEHMKTKHKVKRPFTCKFCSTTFRHNRYMTEHQKKMHSKGKFRCNLCPKVFNLPKRFNKHKLTHSQEPTFNSNDSLAEHNIDIDVTPTKQNGIHTNEKRFKCDICSENVASEVDIKMHMRKHKAEVEGSFACTICPKTFITENLLLKHLAAHKKLDCTLCSATFNCDKDVRAHKLEVHKDVVIECDKCPAVLESVTSFREHIKICFNEITAQDTPYSAQSSPCTKVTLNPCVQPKASISARKLRARKLKDKKSDKQDRPLIIDSIIVLSSSSSDGEMQSNSDEDDLDREVQSYTNISQSGHNQTLEKPNGSLQDPYGPSTSKSFASRPTNLPLLSSPKRKAKALPKPPYIKKPNCKTVSFRSQKKGKLLQKRIIFKCFKCPMSSVGSSSFREHMWEYHKINRPFRCKDCSAAFPQRNSLNRHKLVHSTNRPYKCHLCPGTFKCADNLSKHRKNVHSSQTRPVSKSKLVKRRQVQVRKKQVLICHLCSKSFEVTKQFRKHMRVIHKIEKPFCCQMCPKSFDVKANLMRHSLVHTNKKTFRCDQCTAVFKWADSLNRHAKTEHPNKQQSQQQNQPHKCSVCSASFSKEKLVSTHIMKKHGNKKSGLKKDLFTCKQCKITYNDGVTFRKHMLTTHKIERPFSCQHCSATFGMHAGLIRHLLIHSNKRPFPCEHCVAKFKSKDALNKHQKHSNLAAQNADGTFSCRNCRVKFSAPCLLNKHWQHCQVDKSRFHCRKCPSTFSLKHNLSRHNKVVHSVESRFRCDKCVLTFKCKDSLSKHKKSHKKPKIKQNKKGKFRCSRCGSTFTFKNNLLRHMRHMHGKVQSWSCSTCSVKFKSKEKLRRHMIRFHRKSSLKRKDKPTQPTNERSFKCNLCSGTYPTSTSLQRHQKVVHSNVRPFKCQSCKATFKCTDSLRLHMKKAKYCLQQKK